MSTLFTLLNIAAAAVYAFGTLLIWPSRKNMVAWMALPPFIVSILIPILVIDYSNEFSQSAISLFTSTNVIGATAQFFGLISGGVLFGRGERHPIPAVDDKSSSLVIKRTARMMFACCAVLILCFAWMGFLPLFAADPLLAKFFRGIYQERYMQVAFFYRFAQAFLAAILPIAIAAMFEYRTARLIFLNLIAILLFSVALTRGTAFQGLLVVIAVAASKTRPRLFLLLIALTCVYCFGSMFFYFLGLTGAGEFNLWQEIAWGAPDIKDQIQFMQAFESAGSPFTWGATFVGGLIPGHFAYNPAIFTLSIVNGIDDVSDIASGGFRLNPGEIGYMAFSWAGTIFAPFVSGLLSAKFIKTLRHRFAGSLTSRVAALQAFLVINLFFINFYNLSYSGLVALLAVWYVLHGFPLKRKRRYAARLSSDPTTQFG